VVHSDPFAANGIMLADLMVRAGVPAERVVISHAGDAADRSYLRALADTGCMIGYDRYGMVTFAADEQRTSTLAELVRAGHTRQLLISQDHASHIDYLTLDQRRALWPQWSYQHVARTVIPALLREPGVDETVIREITVGNPARLLAGTVRATTAG
jgi:phosphotriesterase-related protein